MSTLAAGSCQQRNGRCVGGNTSMVPSPALQVCRAMFREVDSRGDGHWILKAAEGVWCHVREAVLWGELGARFVFMRRKNCVVMLRSEGRATRVLRGGSSCPVLSCGWGVRMSIRITQVTPGNRLVCRCSLQPCAIVQLTWVLLLNLDSDNHFQVSAAGGTPNCVFCAWGRKRVRYVPRSP